jgi:hypothetical protein
VTVADLRGKRIWGDQLELVANRAKTKVRSYAAATRVITNRSRAVRSVSPIGRRGFDAVYPEYDVAVLFGDGRPASSRTLLLKVRPAYD